MGSCRLLCAFGMLLCLPPLLPLRLRLRLHLLLPLLLPLLLRRQWAQVCR